MAKNTPFTLSSLFFFLLLLAFAAYGQQKYDHETLYNRGKAYYEQIKKNLHHGGAKLAKLCVPKGLAGVTKQGKNIGEPTMRKSFSKTILVVGFGPACSKIINKEGRNYAK